MMTKLAIVCTERDSLTYLWGLAPRTTCIPQIVNTLQRSDAQNTPPGIPGSSLCTSEDPLEASENHFWFSVKTTNAFGGLQVTFSGILLDALPNACLSWDPPPGVWVGTPSRCGPQDCKPPTTHLSYANAFHSHSRRQNLPVL